MRASIALKTMTLFSTQGPATTQEDSILARKERGLFVVADGFGGGVHGKSASSAACDSVLGFLEKEAGDLDATLPFVLRKYYSLAGNVLFNSILFANKKVMALNQGKTANTKGGSSVLAAYVDEEVLALAHVGVCSAWLMRAGKGVELVAPRSYGRFIDSFCVDPHLDRAVPLSALGMSEDLEPEIVECRIMSGDWLLLQTDGVRNEIREEFLRLQVESPDFDPEEFIQARTFPENASFIFLRF